MRAVMLGAVVLLVGCEGEVRSGPDIRPVEFGRPVYGIDNANTLVEFGTIDPGRVVKQLAVSGLAPNEQLLGLDFGPRDGLLYGVGITGRIYQIDTTSATATQIGVTTFTPSPSGLSFGVDFNPVPNRIRLHSDVNQNLRLNPLTGALAAIDSSLSFATADQFEDENPQIVGTAYTVTIGDTTQTTLFAIDALQDILVRLPSPNDGLLETIGFLGFNTTTFVGFDITPAQPGGVGTAFAALTPAANGPSQLFTISLNNGLATPIGQIGHDRPLRGIAVAP